MCVACYRAVQDSDGKECAKLELTSCTSYCSEHRIIDNFIHRKETIEHNTNQIKLNNN